MATTSRVSVPLPEIYQPRFAEAVRTQDRRANGFAALTRDAGESVTASALRQLYPITPLQVMPTGHKGFDILLDGRVRIQVKASTMIDEVQGIFRNFDFDVAVIVDLGIAIRERPSAYRDLVSFPFDPHVAFYIMPTDEVEKNVISNRGGHYIYWIKDPVRAARTATKHYRQFPEWRDRWEIVDHLLR